MTVADLLKESMAAHQQALYARQHKATISAVQHLERAYRLRLDAHQQDPNHTDPAWQAERGFSPAGKDTHAEMLKFYEQQLGPLL